ncbi:MAG: LamG domain-containing protein [Gammaproteobacteria bacterium]|uniref:Putative lectin/glucanase superfamily protein n=1 Tax=viral metagenome TaxID=1070528 RepID=A0A6M3ISF3_9ZZZZ|nr:LamG domain-containing protein [Gammaproteobacteria bacterium]
MARAPRYKFSPSYRDAVLATNPVGYWRLGEAAGTVARDVMGLLHGTYVGGPTLGVAGLLAGDSDTAVTLDGATQGITFALPALSTYSIGLWCNPTGNANVYDRLFCNPGGGRVDMGRASQGELSYHNGTAWVMLGDVGTLPTGARAFVVFSFDGTLTKCHVNATGIYSAAGGQTLLAGTATWGAYEGAVSSFLGLLDDPAIWDRALTPDEIATLYRIGMGR